MIRYFTAALCFILAGCAGSGEAERKFITGKGAVAPQCMVVSAHPSASAAGAEIMSRGGNAVDAAVATGFALAVCYPEAGNLGGGGFMLIRTADGLKDAIDFREKAPMLAFREMFLDKTNLEVLKGVSTDTHLASGVPGSVDGLIEAHKKYGSLPFRTVIEPAIRLAEKGFPLTNDQVRSFNSNRNVFIERNRIRPAFVKDSLWKEGDILVQQELANTLKLIRDKGRKGFYEGRTANLIVAEMKRGFGIITHEDMTAYHSVWRTPVERDYRGHRIITMSPPSGGGVTLLQILTMIEPFEIGSMKWHSAGMIHLVTEAERRSFADRAFYLGDPEFVFVPLEKLLDRQYLNARMESFNPERATPSDSIWHGDLKLPGSEETTHFSVVDQEGNAVAVTTTLNGTFGNSIVVEGAGFLLNNEMDDFSVKPGYPNMYGLVGGEANGIRPGKRMLSSMTPTIVERNGELLLVAGSPGGSTIPTSVLQVLINVIDYEMDIQTAVDALRFHHQWKPDVISYETGAIDSLTIDDLESKGHSFRSRSAIGRVNAIMKLKDGSLKAGADPRGNNAACGF